MKIVVNGVSREHADGAELAEVLAAAGVGGDAAVAVQRNGEFVDPGAYATTVLTDGDTVEYLYFLGGGAVR